MSAIGVELGLAGLALLAWRMTPRAAPPLPGLARPPVPPRVSIIVPARNEAKNLPALLHSLAAIRDPAPEIIVVDDRSADDTAAIARAHGARVVAGLPLPSGWSGKQWACHQGAAVAEGDFLLFTDADTVHAPDGLARAIAAMQAQDLGLASCLPYHAGTTWWERLTGPFHLLLLAVTAPYADPKQKRVYAIGQFLLFRRAAYRTIGGHEAVKGAFVEDLPLANRALAQGVRYGVLAGAPYFHVRMYATLGDFIRGWRRNFRAGLGGSTALAPLEITLMIAAFAGGGAPLLTVLTIALAAFRQRDLGSFSIWGAVLFPFSLVLFCLVTALAVFDMVFARKLLWKGRAYSPEAMG